MKNIQELVLKLKETFTDTPWISIVLFNDVPDDVVIKNNITDASASSVFVFDNKMVTEEKHKMFEVFEIEMNKDGLIGLKTHNFLDFETVVFEQVVIAIRKATRCSFNFKIKLVKNTGNYVERLEELGYWDLAETVGSGYDSLNNELTQQEYNQKVITADEIFKENPVVEVKKNRYICLKGKKENVKLFYDRIAYSEDGDNDDCNILCNGDIIRLAYTNYLGDTGDGSFNLQMKERFIENGHKYDLNETIDFVQCLEDDGFKITNDDGQYLKASRNGKRLIQVNREGCHMGIQEDCGTRVVFNGRCFNKEQYELLSLLVC